MRYAKFKRNLKKEFNENYEENNKKKKISIWIKFIPAYVALILGFAIVIDRVSTDVYNKKYDDRITYYDDINYRPLEKISKKDYLDMATYNPRESFFESLLTGTRDYNGANIEPESDGVNIEPENYPGWGMSIPSNDTHFETNNQEEGIIEADIAKFDGKYCYYVSDNYLYIYDLNGTQVTKQFIFDDIIYSRTVNLQIYQNKIIVMTYRDVCIYLFENNSLIKLMTLESFFEDESRIIDNYLYVVQYKYYIEEEDLEDTLYSDMVSNCSRFYKIYKINLDTMESKSIVGTASNISTLYMSDTHIVITSGQYLFSVTKGMCLCSVFDLDLNPVGVFVVEGNVLDQYSIDVYDNTLRVVSTYRGGGLVRNELTIFDLKDCVLLSNIYEGIGLTNESVKSATFTDTTCYIVTYYQTDPLYEIDITDPKNPIIVDALKAPGFSSYLKTFSIGGVEYVFGAGIINGSYKYSIFKNDETNTQVGKDYILEEKITIVEKNGSSYEYYKSANSCSIDPHAMFFYIKDDILYFGVPFNFEYYTLYKIDVKSENVIEEYKVIDTTTETRLFLYEGKLYLPQTDKLIIQSFIE